MTVTLDTNVLNLNKVPQINYNLLYVLNTTH